jgi:hypothetical protein
MVFLAHGQSSGCAAQDSPLQPFEEPHYPVAYWARLWGFSSKTVREWFRDEFGPGILRQQNCGRRSKRDYTTMMISPTAARRVYAQRTNTNLIHSFCCF